MTDKAAENLRPRTERRRPYTVSIGMDALVVRADGSSINFGDAIYHPENVAEARAYAEAEPSLAGHRIDGPHDCFAMDCKGLGYEVERLRVASPETPEAAPALDVERLCEAMAEADDGTGPYTRAFTERTAAIYARLASEKGAKP